MSRYQEAVDAAAAQLQSAHGLSEGDAQRYARTVMETVAGPLVIYSTFNAGYNTRRDEETGGSAP